MLQRFWFIWLVMFAVIISSGDEFWQFNVLELFATVAIVMALVLAAWKWYTERKRKDGLIDLLSDKWSAQRNLPQDRFNILAYVDVFLEYKAISYKSWVRIGKSALTAEGERPRRAMIDSRWSLPMSAPLSSIPIDATEVEIDIEITLDGNTKKRSGWCVIPISTWPTPELSSPDTAANQTEGVSARCPETATDCPDC